MERHHTPVVAADGAREQLRAARQAHDASMRRALPPAGLILAVSLLSAAITISPSHRGPGPVLTIVSVVWLVAELLRLSARNQWQALRSMPKPRWNATESALMVAAVVVGAVIGPHVLASPTNSAAASWGFGAVVAVAVAACLFAARASYRRRSLRAWRR